VSKIRPARRTVALVIAGGLLLSLVGAGVGAGTGAVEAGSPPLSAGGSVNQVYVTALAPEAPVELLDSGDAVVGTGTTDAQGAFLFKEVAKGSGYRVRQGLGVSAPLTVTDPDDNPPQSFFEGITLGEGYGYLPTRDGTQLSVNVHFPIDGSPGPWPVVVDYSGYDPAAPGDPPAEALFFLVQGYVVVGANMRGTGCSGGAFDYFEALQSTDGYDIVEAVARQAWSNGDVGLVGISYSGISQLFVAQTRPPHLRAITPLSVIADTYRSTLYPGGILNRGFALDWATDRVNAAKPAARQWAKDRISAGDATCAANQALRLQSRNLLDEIRPGRFYEAAGDELSPRTFVDGIDVPVYLSGQFHDEQTGGHFSTMIPDFARRTKLRVTLTNGTHVEPLGPEQVVGLMEFVDFYVGKRKPSVSPLVRFGAPMAYEDLFGTKGAFLPPDRFASQPSYAAALAAYEAEPPVKLLWENGAGRGPGEPFATAQTTHAAWPPPEASARTWFFHPDGQLHELAPFIGTEEPRGVSVYEYDPSTKRESTFAGSTQQIWTRCVQAPAAGCVSAPTVQWDPLAEGNALSFVSPAMTNNTAFAGWGSVDLWLRSEATDTDLEVTLTEVRPDGQEMFIQSGWLRASHRQLDPAESTPLLAVHTHVESDASPLPDGEFVPVRVALFPFAHVVRPGSRLRLNIEAPGGNQPFWKFDALPGPHRNEVAHSAALLSKVVLPVLPTSPPVPAAQVACPSIRNQPCRPYRPDRVPTGVTVVDDGTEALLVTWDPPERSAPPSGYRISISQLADPDVDVDAPVDEVLGNQPVSLSQPLTGGGGSASVQAFGDGPLPVRVVDVDGGTGSYRWAEATKGVPYVATVQAFFGADAGPVSNASLSAVVGEPRPIDPPSPQPAVPEDGYPDAAASAPSTVGIGDLPRTGSDQSRVVVLAAGLVLGGLLLVAVTWRARGRRRGAQQAH
jgi:uncharacterized protein